MFISHKFDFKNVYINTIILVFTYVLYALFIYDRITTRNIDAFNLYNFYYFFIQKVCVKVC